MGALGGLVEGTPFGRFRLTDLLGRGGMGEVWRAYDTETHRVVALKLLPASLAHDERYVMRFRREAEAAAQLNNPHIIPIHQYGEIDGRLYVDMRLVEGRSLEEVLAEGPLEPSRAVAIIQQVARALHAAHRVNLLHRDVKPSNVLIDEDDFAYLIDFGIARATTDTRLTTTGAVIGTFHYIAPERLTGEFPEDSRVDIYALSCVLFELLTGRPPFHDVSGPALVVAHLHNAPPRLATVNPDLPPALDDVIAKGMAKRPDQRFATSRDFAEAAQAALVAPKPSPANVVRGPIPGTFEKTTPLNPVSEINVLRFAARSDRGLDSPVNEDSVYAGPRLLAVADGATPPRIFSRTGRSEGGEVASELVIHNLAPLDDREFGDDLFSALAEAVRAGNAAIAARLRSNPALFGASTTLTAMLFSKNRFGVVHLGHSRAFVLRDGGFMQITRDNGLALNGERTDIHVTTFDARPGDRFLLCTRGVHGCVDPAAIMDAMFVPDVDECADRLIELGLRNGSMENITAAVADVVRYRRG